MRTFATALAWVLALGSSPLAHAITNVSTSGTIAAGVPADVTVTLDYTNPDSNDFDGGPYTGYTIYLGIGSSICVLLNYTSLNITTTKVVIPPSVGPSGRYEIGTTDYYPPNPDIGSGEFQWSYFTLTGGTGVFSSFEINDKASFGDGSLPCSALDCVRQCYIVVYPNGTVTGDLQGDRDANWYKLYDCSAKCPGVDYPSIKDPFADNATSTAPLSTLIILPTSPTSTSSPSPTPSKGAAAGNAVPFLVMLASSLGFFTALVNL